MTNPEKRKRAEEYLGTSRRWPQHFLFPRRYFRDRVKILAPVPAYFYHQAEAAEFERIFSTMSQRGIRGITFGDMLNGNARAKDSALISFDDGWSTTWSIAFPLARRYGVRFTLFVAPELIEESDECRTGLGEDELETLVSRDHGPRPMLTWGELKRMVESGVVDVQSHTNHHGVVFKSDSLRGFATPDGPFPLNGMSPCVSRVGGADLALSRLAPGTPVYEWGPALAVRSRYLEDEAGRERCQQLVKEEGGGAFFRRGDWEQQLKAALGSARDGAWESDVQRRARIRCDLETARGTIEKKLPGIQVRVVAPPWALMHPEFPSLARETGHDLVVLGYPFPSSLTATAGLPAYPRLYGDAIWALLKGPLVGGVGWLRSRRRAIARVAQGAIP